MLNQNSRVDNDGTGFGVGCGGAAALVRRAERLAIGSLQWIGRGRGWTRALSGALLAAACAPALAGPEGAQVVRGNVRIERDGANTLIHAGRNSIINYRSFDIASSESVRFVQPDAASRVLNRINSAAPTRIDGSLMANGRVYIINPAGVMFGNGASVNVTGLYAAAGNLSNADFVRGINNFTNLKGTVRNEGTITANFVGLLGRHVENLGSIVATGGTVVMASGDEVMVGKQRGNIYVKIKSDGAQAAGVGTDNAGTIDATRGRVVMGAGDMYAMAVRTSGSVKAKDIKIEGKGGGIVSVSGSLDASNQGAGGKGGSVEVLGEKIGLFAADIDASGANGGGTVHIGGDFQGMGARRKADAVYINHESSINVDATGAGNGGTAVVWSEEVTKFYGEATARGGATGGNGGLIETSSKGVLDLNAVSVDASAAQGQGGLWLLDPRNVTISGMTSVPGDYDTSMTPHTFTPSSNNSNLNAASVNSSLSGGTDVTITTSDASGNQAGDIIVSTAISKTGGDEATLRLIAQDDIDVNATIGSTVDQLNVILIANDPGVAGDMDNVTMGSVTVDAVITTNGGDFSSSGVDFGNTAAINVGGGSVSINHTGNVNLGAAITATGTGTITSSGVNFTSVVAGTIGAGTGLVSINHTGDVVVGGAITTTGGNVESAGDDFDSTGTIDAGDGSVTIDHAGIVTIAGAITTTDGVISSTGTNFISTGAADIDAGAGSVSIDHAGSVVIDGTITAQDSILARSGSDGSGNLSFEPGAVLSSDVITLRAGDGAAGTNTATVDANTDSPTFRDFAGTDAPGRFMFQQDAALSTATATALPVLARFQGGDVTGVDYTIQSDAGAVTIISQTNLTTSDLTLTGTSVAINTNLILNGLTTNGPTSLGANVTTSGDAVQFNGVVTLATSSTIDTTSGAATGANIGFSSTVNGTADLTQTLTLAAGTVGDISITGATGGGVGSTTRLSFLTINNAHNVMTSTIRANNIQQDAGTGLTTLGVVNIASGAALTGTNFTLGAFTSGAGLTVTNSGLLTVGGAVDLQGAFVQANSGGTGSSSLGAGITTANQNIGFDNDVVLTANTVLNAGTATVAFAGDVAAGANDLTVTADEVNFTGGIGSVTGAAGSTLTLQPSTATASIDIGFVAPAAGDLDISASDILAIEDGFDGIVIGRSNGEHDIIIDGATFLDPIHIQTPVAGSIMVNGTLAGTDNASVTLTGSGATTTLNADIITDGTTILIDDTVVLGANVLLDTTNGATFDGADIEITGAVNADTAGMEVLTLQAGSGALGGDITLGGAVGATRLGGFTINSVDAVLASSIAANFITQAGGTGVGSYSGLLTTSGVAAGNISLTGSSFSLGTGASTAGGAIAINGALVLSGATVTLDTRVGAVALAGQDITITGAVTGTVGTDKNLTLNAGTLGLIDVQSSVTTDVGNLIVSNAADVQLDTVDVSGVVQVTTGTLTANSTIDSGGTIRITNSGLATLSGAVNSGANFFQDGLGDLSVGGSITTAGGSGIEIDQNVTILADDLEFNAGGAAVVFKKNLTIGANDLTITGDEINFDGGANSVSGMRTLTLQPGNNNASISINGGAATLDLTAADLAAMLDGFTQLTIGRSTGLHAITVTGTATFRDPTLIRTPAVGGTITAGQIVGTGDASISLVSNGLISLTGGIRTDGDFISLAGPVRLAAGTVTLDTTNAGAFAGDDLTIDGTVVAASAGAQHLTLRAGAGDLLITDTVGAATAVGALTIVSANNIDTESLRASSIVQTNASTGTSNFGTLTSLGLIGIALNGVVINLNGGATAIEAAPISITNSGLLTIQGGAITALGGFTQSGAGNVQVNSAITTTPTTGDAISFAGNVTVGPLVTDFNAGGAAITFSQDLNLGTANFTLTAGDLAFNGGNDSVTGGGILTLQPGANNTSIGINGGAGAFTISSTDLAALTDGFMQVVIGRAAGLHVIDIGAGASFRDPVLIRTPVVGGSITSGQINGTDDASITLVSNGTISLSDGITTQGQFISVTGPVRLVNTVNLDTTELGGFAGADLDITGTVEGASAGGQGLAMRTGTGDIGITGAVGATNELTTFNVFVADDIDTATVRANSITQVLASTGTSTFGTLTTLGGGGITLRGVTINLDGGASAVDGSPFDVTNSGLLTIDGAITALGGFAQLGTGDTQLNAGITTTAVAGDAIFFTGDVAVGPSVTQLNSGMQTITFSQGLDLGSNNFTLTGDEINFNGAANSVVGTGILTLQPSTATTSIGLGGGAGTLDLSTIDLAALSATLSQVVIGRIAGEHDITINASDFRSPVLIRTPTAGSITVDGQITGSGLASVTLVGSGMTTTLNANIVTAGQDILIDDNVILGADVELDTTDGVAAGADIEITGTLNGTFAGTDDLGIRAGTGGDFTLGADAGVGTRLGALTIFSARNVTTQAVSAASITQFFGNATGTSTFNGLLDTNGSGISLTANDINLLGGVNTTNFGGLTVTNGGTLTISNAALTLDGAFNQIGTGPVDLGADITTTDDAVGFASPVMLTGPVTITTDFVLGNDITFSDTLDGGFNLTLVAGTGTVTFGGLVGGGTPLANLMITAGAVVNNAIRAAQVTVATADDLLITDDITALTGPIDLRAGTDGTGDLTFGLGVDLSAASIFLRAGDGPAGGGTAAFVDAVGNGPVFHGAAGGATSPSTFSIRQDANLGDVLTPDTAQFASGITNVLYTLRSDDGVVDVDSAVKVDTSRLVLVSATGVNVNTSIAPRAMTVSGPLNLSGDINANFGVSLNGPVLIVGGSREISSGGTLTLAQTLDGDANDVTLTANEIDLLGAVSGSGALVLQPFTANTQMVLGGTGVGNPLAALSLTTSELGQLVNGFSSITIGRADSSGSLSLASAVDFFDPVTLRSSVGAGSVNIGFLLCGLDNASVILDGASNVLTAGVQTQGNAITVAGDLQVAGNVALDATKGGTFADGADVSVSGTTNADLQASNRQFTVNGGNLGDVNLGGAVGAGVRLGSLTASGSTVALNGVRTANDQTYTGLVTLTGDLTLQVAGDIDIMGGLRLNSDSAITTPGGASDDVSISGAVDSTGADRVLTINTRPSPSDAGGAITIGGSATELQTFTATGGSISVATVRTAGSQTYTGGTTVDGDISGTSILFNDAVTLARPSTMAGTTSVVFNSTIDSQAGEDNGLAINSPDARLRGSVGAGTNGRLGFLTTNAGGTVQLSGPVINTQLSQVYGGTVTLLGNLVASSSNGNVLFNQSLLSDSTPRALTVNTIGTTLFGGTVGATNPLASITTDAGGTTTVTGNVTTAGLQTYGDAVVLAANSTFAGNGINFASTINSDGTARALVLNGAGGGVSVAGAVGGTSSMASVVATTSGGGAIALRSVTSTGTQQYTGDTTLNGDLRSTASGPIVITGDLLVSGPSVIRTAGLTGGDDISVTGTVNAFNDAHALTLNSGLGDTTLAGNVGLGTGLNENPLASLTATGATLNLRSVQTLGSQLYAGVTTLNGNLTTTGVGSIAVDGPLTLANNTIVTTANGAVTFVRTVDSDSTATRSLTVTTGGGNTTFGGALGGTFQLTSLTTSAMGRTFLNGGSVRTTQDQTYSGATTLGNATTLAGNDITFSGTLDSDALGTARALTVNSFAVGGDAGATTFTGAAGGLFPLMSLTTNAEGTTAVAAGLATSNGASFNDAVTVTGTGAIAGGAGALVFGNTLSSTANLSGTGMTFTGAATISGGATSVDGGTGALLFNSTLSTVANLSGTGMTFVSGVTIGGNVVVDGRTGTLLFRSSLNPDQGNTRQLTLLSTAAANAGSTPFKFNNNIGTSTVRFGAVTLGADRATAGTIAATAAFGSYNAEGRLQNQGLTNTFSIFTSGGFAMGRGQRITAMGALTIDGGTGTVALGDLTALTNISVIGSGISIKLRDNGPIADNTVGNEDQFDTGTDFVARDDINFSVVPTLDGSGNLSFSTDDAVADQQLLGFTHREFDGGTPGNGVRVGLFADPANTALLLGLDLRAEGPSGAGLATSIAGAIPRDTETREQISHITVDRALRDELQEMGVSTRELSTGDLIEFMVGRALYRDLPLKARPSIAGNDYQVTVNRLTMSTVQAAVAAYRNLVFTAALDESGAPLVDEQGQVQQVNRTQLIQDIIGEAWDGYEAQVEEPDGLGFRAYLEAKSTAQEGGPEGEALAFLNATRDVLEKLDALGLSPFEASIPKTKLLGELRPPAMSEEAFLQAVNGGQLAMK